MSTPNQEPEQKLEFQQPESMKSNQESAELQRLQGMWREVFALRGGKDNFWSSFRSLEIKGNKFEAYHAKAVSGEIRVDTQQLPFTISFNYYTDGGDYDGDKLEGIYRFDDELKNVLIINLGLGESDRSYSSRPDKFDSTLNSTLLVFVRQNSQ
jgi:uncharacterized protein (TIGR03067 family)